MSFSYQYEAVKEAARQQEREADRNDYQPQPASARPAGQARAQTGGWRERIMRAFAPARRNEASPEGGQHPR